MKKLAMLALLAGLVYWYRSEPEGPAVSSLPEIKSFTHTMRIEGDALYIQQVNHCLDVLASRAEEEYQVVLEHIGVISQNSRTGMKAWEDPPRFDMSNTTAFSSGPWCANSISHDAYHSYLYKGYKLSPYRRTEYELWAGFEAERKAIAYQLESAEKIGMSSDLVVYLKSLDGSHGDVNGDGKLTSEDYVARTW